MKWLPKRRGQACCRNELNSVTLWNLSIGKNHRSRTVHSNLVAYLKSDHSGPKRTIPMTRRSTPSGKSSGTLSQNPSSCKIYSFVFILNKIQHRERLILFST